MTADKASLEVAAIVFAESKRGGVFAARDFTSFLTMGGVTVEEERADEILSDMVDDGRLRQIGPGVYASNPARAGKPVEVPLQHPLWPEDAGQ